MAKKRYSELQSELRRFMKAMGWKDDDLFVALRNEEHPVSHATVRNWTAGRAEPVASSALAIRRLIEKHKITATTAAK